MKKFINHKNRNLRKNGISNLEIIKEEPQKETVADILIELSDSERMTRRLNCYRSKDNCITEDMGKEIQE